MHGRPSSNTCAMTMPLRISALADRMDPAMVTGDVPPAIGSALSMMGIFLPEVHAINSRAVSVQWRGLTLLYPRLKMGHSARFSPSNRTAAISMMALAPSEEKMTGRMCLVVCSAMRRNPTKSRHLGGTSHRLVPTIASAWSSASTNRAICANRSESMSTRRSPSTMYRALPVQYTVSPPGRRSYRRPLRSASAIEEGAIFNAHSMRDSGSRAILAVRSTFAPRASSRFRTSS